MSDPIYRCLTCGARFQELPDECPVCRQRNFETRADVPSAEPTTNDEPEIEDDEDDEDDLEDDEDEMPPEIPPPKPRGRPSVRRPLPKRKR
jgi:predicted  nucleic acid-binding Zn-ribbon protein